MMRSRRYDAVMMSLVISVALLLAGCIYCSIPYEDLSDPESERSLHCITVESVIDSNSIDQEFIITTEEDYQELLQYKSSSVFCEDFILPEIDFSKYSLLGKYTAGSGCTVDFLRNVCTDNLNKKILFYIIVAQEGLCEMMATSMNWTLIPGIPSDFDVEFRVFKINLDE